MSNDSKLAPKQIVWAKVQPYPWWPGKIVKILSQNNKQVFKVSFFADPTYTYLHSHQLVPFQQFDQSLNANHQFDQELRKAKNMAYAYVAKSTTNNKAVQKKQIISLQPDLIAQQIKEEYTQQKMKMQQEKSQQSHEVDCQTEELQELNIPITQINIDNVIEVIQNNMKAQKKMSYCYEKRKQQISFQNKLKQQLLLKYNLLHIDTEKENIMERPFRPQHIIKITAQKKIVPKSKKIFKSRFYKHAPIDSEIQSIKDKCLKKLSVFLKNTTDSAETTKLQSIQLMRRISILSDNNCSKLQSLFIALIRSMKGFTPNLSCQQRLVDFNQYLQRFENEKHQDEQGSKVTQIQAIN